MKIPFVEGSQVSTRALPSVSTNVNRGVPDYVARGLEAVARGIGEVGQAYDGAMRREALLERQRNAEAERARQQAADVEALDAETELAKEIGLREVGDELRPEGAKTVDVLTGAGGTSTVDTSVEGPTGLLQKRGKLASESYAETMDALRKRQQKLAEQLNTPEAKQTFLRRSEVMIERSREKLDRHVYQQNQVAAVESVRARQKTLLDDVYRAPLDDSLAEDAVAAMEGPISSLAVTPDGADRAVAEWQGKVASARLDAMLASGEWASAEKVLAGSKPVLGVKAAEYEAKVGKVRTAAKASALAASAVAGSVEPNGRVNVDAALAKVEGATGAGIDAATGEVTEADEPMRKAAAARVAEKARAHNQRWDEETRDVKRRAGAQFNAAGFASIPQDLKDELNRRDPDYYRRLRDYELNAYRARERFRRAGEGGEKKAQAEANRLALQDYLKRPLEERLQLDVPAEYAGSGADKLGVGDIEVRQRKEKDAQAKGLLVGENAFVAQARAAVEPFVDRRYASGSKKDKAARKDTLDEAEAKARSRYVDHVLDSGKKPTPKEASEIAAEVASGIVSSAISGKRPPGPPPQTSAPKKVRGPKGETATWYGKKPLPEGWTVIDG